MRILHKSLFLTIFTTIIISISGCSGRTATDKTIVTVSIPPQQYLLEQIAGDAVDVRCLMSNGGNPESFEPSISNLMDIEKSDAYFCIGNLGFESELTGRIKQNNPDLKIIDTSVGIDLIRGTHEDCHHHHHGHENHNAHESVDPHVWSSLQNGKTIARNMCKTLIEINPEKADIFRNNLTRLETHIDSIDAEIRTRLQPMAGEAFMVWHPSLSYFARDYGLNQISIGVEGKEISIQTVKAQIDEAREHNAKIFFSQKDFDTKQAEVVCNDIGTPSFNINPLNYEWDAELTAIANAFASTRNN